MNNGLWSIFWSRQKPYKILHFIAKYSKETVSIEAEYLYSTMRDKIPDFPSNLPLINAENHLNSDTLEDRKESWYQFFFHFRRSSLYFLIEGKHQCISNVCACSFSLTQIFWSVFLYLKIVNEDEDSKTVPKLKFCCQFRNLFIILQFI